MTVILTRQIGSGPRRTCSGTCHNARKDKCACICGGRYHGIARGGKRPKNIEEADAMKGLRKDVQALFDYEPKEVAVE